MPPSAQPVKSRAFTRAARCRRCKRGMRARAGGGRQGARRQRPPKAARAPLSGCHSVPWACGSPGAPRTGDAQRGVVRVQDLPGPRSRRLHKQQRLRIAVHHAQELRARSGREPARAGRAHAHQSSHAAPPCCGCARRQGRSAAAQQQRRHARACACAQSTRAGRPGHGAALESTGAAPRAAWQVMFRVGAGGAPGGCAASGGARTRPRPRAPAGPPCCSGWPRSWPPACAPPRCTGPCAARHAAAPKRFENKCAFTKG